MLDPVLVQRIVWLVLLLLFAAGEAVSVGLTSIWFAAGALAALIAAMLGGGLVVQIVLFVAVSILCLLAVRPLAAKYLNNKTEPTNADRVIGSEALVTETIDNVKGIGAVIIGGIAWTARSCGDVVIPKGTTVRVMRIEGVKVYVQAVKEAVKC